MKGEVVGYRTWKLDPDQELLLPTVNYLAPPWQREGPTEAACYPMPSRMWITPAYNLAPQVHFSTTTSWSPAPAHRIAGPHCHCGLYAYPYLPTCWVIPPDEPSILGVVLTWGLTTSHGQADIGLEGFRAQFARPLVLVQHEASEYHSVVKRIASRVGASVVTDYTQLQARTREWRHIKEAVNFQPDGLMKYSLRF